MQSFISQILKIFFKGKERHLLVKLKTIYFILKKIFLKIEKFKICNKFTHKIYFETAPPMNQTVKFPF